MSDISLDYGFLDSLILTLFIGWPIVLAGIAIGAAIGALAWRSRRPLGGGLGCLLGALIGWPAGYGGYIVWADSDLSVSVSFPDAMLLALARGAPGLFVGAAIGAATLRRRPGLGAVVGAVIGAALSAALWFALAGGG